MFDVGHSEDGVQSNVHFSIGVHYFVTLQVMRPGWKVYTRACGDVRAGRVEWGTVVWDEWSVE